MGKRVDLTGKRFGNWLVLQATKSDKQGYYYLCRCDCGTEKEVRGNILTSKKTKSCGCNQKIRARDDIKGKRDILEKQRFEGCLVPLLRRKKSDGKTSKYKGVSYSKNCNKYRAYIGINHKTFGLGFYDTEEKANEARMIAEKFIFEPFLLREKKKRFLCEVVHLTDKEADELLEEDSYLNKKIEKALEIIEAS